jgi:hypothetical protein
MAKYTYRPLSPPKSGQPQFRVLLLRPGAPPSPIVCSLKHTSFDTHPEYTALSYCWGRGVDKPQTIQCDGVPFPVTENLHEFLVTYRHPHESRKLWIDAICIDQENEDPSEKNHQVALMRHIYSNSAGVIAWLGASTPTNDTAMELLRNFTGTSVRIWQQVLAQQE